NAMNIQNLDSIKLYKSRGCDDCNQTGFYGRSAIYELLPVTEEIRAAILEKKRANDIKQIAVNNGMRTLRQDGWQKVLDGLTTPAEVMNITEKDELFEEKEVADFSTKNK